jgi:hypothetical protein
MPIVCEEKLQKEKYTRDADELGIRWPIGKCCFQSQQYTDFLRGVDSNTTEGDRQPGRVGQRNWSGVGLAVFWTDTASVSPSVSQE